jgi:cytochrome c556
MCIRNLFGILLGAAMALSLSNAAVQAGTAHEARSAAMKSMVGHMKVLGAVAKGKAKADAATSVHGMALQSISMTIPYLFPKGSGGGTSRAKDEIWAQWDKFQASADALAAATPALAAAAKTGDAAQIGTAIGAVGKACGACHKAFRAPKKK